MHDVDNVGRADGAPTGGHGIAKGIDLAVAIGHPEALEDVALHVVSGGGRERCHPLLLHEVGHQDLRLAGHR